MTTGRVYQAVIERERNLGYGGKCVQVVPHIPMEVRGRIQAAVEKTGAEIMIIEIGGTVGEYENMLFLAAARVMHLENPGSVLFVMVTYLPVPSKIGEMKTKPTQHAVRALNSAGIQPDFIIARSETPIDEPRRKKIAMNCNIYSDDVIAAPDIDSIYDVPGNFEKNHLSAKILKRLGLSPRRNDWCAWQTMADKVKEAREGQHTVKIGIVGKYFTSGNFCLTDSYISVIEALKHAGVANNCRPQLDWLSAEEVEQQGTAILKDYDGLVIPQGWGRRGYEGKIKAIEYCRTHKVPYLGLCYGMQMAVIEFARNVCCLKGANSEEINPKTKYPVIHIMPGQTEHLVNQHYGGTMRLGGWPCKLVSGTHLAHIYAHKFGPQVQTVSERHRHRYEFNNDYRQILEQHGLIISGVSPDGQIVEAIELADHPFFIGPLFHPEFLSRPLDPHP